MSLLKRYLFRQAMFLLLVCLMAGAGMYLLIDIFSRMPEMLEAGVSLGDMGLYFLVKIPIVATQLLPAVFLLSLVLLLSLMKQNREILALESGGISPVKLLSFCVLFGFLWAVAGFVFSEVVGIKGQNVANAIWLEKVKEVDTAEEDLNNVWFKEGDMTVGVKTFWPGQKRGAGLTIYFLDEDSQVVERIITARKFTVKGNTWALSQVEESHPTAFRTERHTRMSLELKQDLDSLVLTRGISDDGTSFDSVSIPIWELGELIAELEDTGSNVERLQTSWHTKWAFAFSLVVMGFLAVVLAGWFDNLYLCVILGLLTVFVFFVLFLGGISAAQKGMIPPWLGAWTANFMLTGIGGIRLAAAMIPSSREVL